MLLSSYIVTKRQKAKSQFVHEAEIYTKKMTKEKLPLVVLFFAVTVSFAQKRKKFQNSIKIRKKLIIIAKKK